MTHRLKDVVLQWLTMHKDSGHRFAFPVDPMAGSEVPDRHS